MTEAQTACPFCGVARPGMASLCSSCGRAIPSGVTMIQDDRPSGLPWIVLATLALPLVGLGVGFVWIRDGRRVLGWPLVALAAAATAIDLVVLLR